MSQLGCLRLFTRLANFRPRPQRSGTDTAGREDTKMDKRHRVVSTALGIALAIGPTAAWAVTATSADGSATQRVTEWFNNGAALKGRLTAVQANKPVYLSGGIIGPNDDYGNMTRYTDNVVNGSRNIGGAIADAGYIGKTVGVRFKVCRDIRFFPDPCGSPARINR